MLTYEPTSRETQAIRLVDMFLLGPVMIWFGVSASNMPMIARAFLFMSGVATIAFNWRNYQRLS